MSVTPRWITLFVMAAVVLGGCTNTRKDVTVWTLSKQLVQSIRKDDIVTDQEAAQITARIAAEALQSTDEPLSTLMIPSLKGSTVVRSIATNRAHEVWTPWGTIDRRTVTTKNGIIVATRGVGNDLMSADADGVINLVQRREEGTVQYVQRYLDGDFKIVEAKSTCEVTRGYDKFVELGEVNEPALQMFSSCISADRQFVDLFLVGRDGRILQLRQWVGPKLGFMVMQQLR